MLTSWLDFQLTENISPAAAKQSVLWLRRPGSVCVERGGVGKEARGEHRALLRSVWLKSHLVGLVWCSSTPSNKKHNWYFCLKSCKNLQTNLHAHPHRHTEIQIIICIETQKERICWFTCCMLLLPWDFQECNRGRLQPVPEAKNLKS